MAFWNHRKGRTGTLRSASAEDAAHLARFARTRAGVEAFLEPRTTVTETTVVLVASTGEWTRRRIASPERAASFARKHGIPLYDAATVGYPTRMRQWSAHRREAEHAGEFLG